MPIQAQKQVELFVAWQANPSITAVGLRTAVGVAVETAANYKSRFETGFVPEGATPMPSIAAEARHDSIEMFPVNMVTDHTILSNMESPKISWLREMLFEAQLKQERVARELEACALEVYHAQELLRLNEPFQT